MRSMSDVKSFQEHVKKGGMGDIRAALASDPSLLDAVNEAGQTPFLLAKYYRQAEVAEYLLRLNPKLDVYNACAAGLLESVFEQVDADPTLLTARNSDGWTTLHLAAFFGHAEIAKGLLNRGAAVDARSSNAMENTPLHAAAAGGNVRPVELLLARGADVNARQHGGWTALHSAAQSGHFDIAETLLMHGAAIDVRADNNQSPLDLALLNKREKVAELLEARGAQLQ
jgi:ankyrin repeat protein